jgi:hypothetical protein
VVQQGLAAAVQQSLPEARAMPFGAVRLVAHASQLGGLAISGQHGRAGNGTAWRKRGLERFMVAKA